ncbi:MAG: hypothetical protein HYY06_32895 [Deltaproteobacteria bacterium]|nr:hypothetical protein [Deltaproteobacteria bacterium]
MTPVPSLLGLAFACLAPTLALAQPQGSLDFQLGIARTSAVCRVEADGTDPSCGKALSSLGFTVTRRMGPLAAGGGVEVDGVLLSETHLQFAGIGGLNLWPADDTQIELLGEIGGHLVGGMGSGLFTGSSGPTTLLPSVGLRAGAAARLGRRFLLGIWIIGRQDLLRKNVEVDVQRCLFGCLYSTEEYRVGGWSVTAAIRLGSFL